MSEANSNGKGILFLLIAMLISSLQSIAVKGLGGSYPVLEMVVFRNISALPFTLLFFRMEGRRGLPVTQNPRFEIIRGLFLFLSYTTFMMGLTALPLSEVESIRFSGPVMITVLSVLLLGEKVTATRWFALAVAFAGVFLIVRPGSASFNFGSVFILISVLLYALTIIITRKLKGADSSATMAYFSSFVYLASAMVLVPITLAIGPLPTAHPSIAFLFRSWARPTLLDGSIMCGLGLVWAGWSYFMARAYSLAEASVAAPFEYLSLPISIFWGYTLWHEVPTWLTLIGAALTLSSGMFILYQDRKVHQNSKGMS